MAIEKLTGAFFRVVALLIQHNTQCTSDKAKPMDLVAISNFAPDITAMFRRLVLTFNLTASNIALIPKEWNLAAIVLFASCCHCNATQLPECVVAVDSGADEFFIDNSRFLYSWFPNTDDVMNFIEKFTRAL